MRYIEIMHRENGEDVVDARVYEDGRFEGLPVMKEIIDGFTDLTDPDTGIKQPDRGMPLLNALVERMTNGYVLCKMKQE